MSDGTRKPVRLPFDFGDIVYHRAKSESIRGIVTGFIVRENRVLIFVTWGDNRNEEIHNLFELVTEFEPNFSTES